jgi:hypothetical protein
MFIGRYVVLDAYGPGLGPDVTDLELTIIGWQSGESLPMLPPQLCAP